MFGVVGVLTLKTGNNGVGEAFGEAISLCMAEYLGVLVEMLFGEFGKDCAFSAAVCKVSGQLNICILRF